MKSKSKTKPKAMTKVPDFFYNKELSDVIRDISKNSPFSVDDAALCMKYSCNHVCDGEIVKRLADKGMDKNEILSIIKAINCSAAANPKSGFPGTENVSESLRRVSLALEKLKDNNKTRDYIKFESHVQHYSKQEDFVRNGSELKQVAIENYQIFIDVLKLGAEIVPAIRIVDDLVKVCADKSLTPKEALELEGYFRFINSCFDMQMY